jgi:hypothetical protein
VNYYAFDNDGSGGSINLYDGFPSSEKMKALSVFRGSSGNSGTGGDITNLVSTGPFDVLAGDSVNVAFAIMADDDLSGLQSSAVQAQNKYDVLISTPEKNRLFSWVELYPMPSKGFANLTLSMEQAGEVSVEILNPWGQKLLRMEKGRLPAGKHTMDISLDGLPSGFYLCKVTLDRNCVMRRLIVTQ